MKTIVFLLVLGCYCCCKGSPAYGISADVDASDVSEWPSTDISVNDSSAITDLDNSTLHEMRSKIGVRGGKGGKTSFNKGGGGGGRSGGGYNYRPGRYIRSSRTGGGGGTMPTWGWIVIGLCGFGGVFAIIICVMSGKKKELDDETCENSTTISR